jgi:hypothetical protein
VSPADLAAVILFLASDEARAVLKPNVTRRALDDKDIQFLRNGVPPRHIPRHGGEKRLSRFDGKFGQEPGKVFAQQPARRLEILSGV